ncbi:MAG: hypothetical protein CL739_07425, partial [Chloroflexi bacterium]|nr:hypothetical protein [Chloroflexota bacterium]
FTFIKTTLIQLLFKELSLLYNRKIQHFAYSNPLFIVNKRGFEVRSMTVDLLSVLNPVAQQRGMMNIIKPNQRPSTLEGATVGLVWSGTHGGDLALNRAGEMIQERFSNVSVNFYTGGNYPSPPHIVKQAAEECDVVIGATAD